MSTKLGNDLKSLSDRTTGDGYQRGPLYELPVGDGGYAIHYSLREGMGFLQAGYTLDGTHYTLIEIRGFKKTGGELVALTEQELFADLATLLTAMAG
ncbi:hypothetical protein [Actinophytocola algeriensis]|uniref:Uncharacterized protein n=1 Tax=Actinophytocola algeriensis TaxID=1768010 RepID=A0A7W7QCX7_9PSEU|nr:hypothetical protein [Actinophytocola algeriensis]MBB4911108.1 hypothetical protein [Actinophytocola algeriensis]MBE1479047.1 hypothetical protein [Actinophytocola algeriensis]